MNRKRKVLTIIGLIVLGVIAWAHFENHDHVRLTTLLVPGLFYAGLYAILGGPDKPRNWRRIIKITSLILIALLAIGGSVITSNLRKRPHFPAHRALRLAQTNSRIANAEVTKNTKYPAPDCLPS